MFLVFLNRTIPYSTQNPVQQKLKIKNIQNTDSQSDIYSNITLIFYIFVVFVAVAVIIIKHSRSWITLYPFQPQSSINFIEGHPWSLVLVVCNILVIWGVCFLHSVDMFNPFTFYVLKYCPV
jgi:hypothetical protein